MQYTEILILIIILLLAIPFGYFLHKGLSDNAYEKLLETLERLKLINSQQANLISQLKGEVAASSDKLEKLQTEFFQLTLTSKQLQEQEIKLKKELHEKQYDVPPDYPHLQESNLLLQEEIQKSRAKVKKWKSKDFLKENKQLLKEVKKLKKRVSKLKEENEKYGHSHQILTQIKQLTKVEEPIAREVFPTVKPPKKTKEKKEKVKKNLFSHQPEFKKQQIFNEILNDKPTEENNLVIDLEQEEKTLLDLVGMDEDSIEILQLKGIHTFDEMVQMKIRELGDIFNHRNKDYPYETWPIQARLALRGEWDLIEEYKNRD